MSSRPFRATIRVRPGAARTGVGGQYGQPPALVVRVSERAADGKANAAVVAALARALGVRRSQVHIAVGRTARNKLLEISEPPGGLADEWARLLRTGP